MTDAPYCHCGRLWHSPYCHCEALLKAVAISFSIMTMRFPRQVVCTPFLGMTARSAVLRIVIADNFVTDTPYCHCEALLKAVAISFSIMTMRFPRQGVCTPFLGMTARSAALHIVIANDFVADTPYCHCEAFKSRGNLCKITVKRVNLLARLYFFQTPQSLSDRIYKCSKDIRNNKRVNSLFYTRLVHIFRLRF